MQPELLDRASGPSQGSVVHCRSHRWLVEDVEAPELPGGDTVVRMACLDDDANGQKLEVFWEREVDAQHLGHGGAAGLRRPSGVREPLEHPALELRHQH